MAVLTGGADDPAERAVAVGLVALAGLAALALATGHVAAFLFEGGWPSYPLDEVPGILGRLVQNLLDPAEAWAEVNTGTSLPGPVAWWFTLLLLVALAVAPVLLYLRMAGRRAGRAEAGTTMPTKPKEVRRLGLTREGPAELVVGTLAGQEIAVKERAALLVLGPDRSGKTSSVTVPALLEWPGPVVATSTGGDLVNETIGWRSRQGDVHVYDPVQVTRHRASGWTPLATCTTWLGSQHTAWDLSMAAKAAIGAGVDEFWYSSAARSLAPYLYAAAEADHTMAEVAQWIDVAERDEVLAILRTGEPDAAVAHAATFRREDAARASLFHVMSQIVGAYLDPTVAESAFRHEVEVDELLDGGPHTLYVVAPHHDQARVRPLYAALVRRLVAAVDDRVERRQRPLTAPLLLLLDDTADIAPVEDLSTLASGGAEKNIQLVSVFRDVAQVDARYGEHAHGVLRNHRAKLLLPGAGTNTDALIPDPDADPEDTLVGGTDPLGGVPSALVRDLPSDQGLYLYGDRPPLRVTLRRWDRNRELKARAGAAQDALTPSGSVDIGALSPFGDEVPASPIINPPPEPPPFDMSSGSSSTAPHFPSNVSPLDAARSRLRRKKAPSSDR